MTLMPPETRPLRSWAERRNIIFDARKFGPGDEAQLCPEEAASLRSSRAELLQASGAARCLARDLLARLGAPCGSLVKDADGVPSWPPGFVGSLAHDATHALAAVARERDIWALGVDLEPDLPMAPEMIDLVATPAERAHYDEDFLRGPSLFVVKEAVFKALFPRERRFLDYRDIEVDLDAGRARAGSAIPIDFILERGRQVCALAAITASNYKVHA